MKNDTCIHAARTTLVADDELIPWHSIDDGNGLMSSNVQKF